MLYELVAGRVPFTGDTAISVMLKHINNPPPPPVRLNPNISSAADRVLLKALAKKPAARFATVREFYTAWSNANRFSVPTKPIYLAATPRTDWAAPAPAPGNSLNNPRSGLFVGGLVAVGLLASLAIVVVFLTAAALLGDRLRPTVSATVASATLSPVPTQLLATATSDFGAHIVPGPTLPAPIKSTATPTVTTRPSATASRVPSATASLQPSATASRTRVPAATRQPNTATPVFTDTPAVTATPTCPGDQFFDPAMNTCRSPGDQGPTLAPP
jgi:serine/threonine protein kinase